MLLQSMRPEKAGDELQLPEARVTRPDRPATFREKFCAAFACPEENFERELLKRALPPVHKVLCRAIQCLRPRHFQRDVHAIARLGSATTSDEFTTGIESVQYSFRQEHPVLRTLCRTRVSGKRLLRLYTTVFPLEAGEGRQKRCA